MKLTVFFLIAIFIACFLSAVFLLAYIVGAAIYVIWDLIAEDIYEKFRQWKAKEVRE